MAYPDLKPSGRTFDPGNWPVRTYNAQSGAEVRLIYGSKRFGLKLQLSYTNIPDTDAELFLQHYEEVLGTYKTFQVTATNRVEVLAGWGGSNNALTPPTGVDWRYAQPPQVVSVRPGVSTVTVSLLGVI